MVLTPDCHPTCKYWDIISRFEGNRSIQEVDPKIADILKRENDRQVTGINLIASENYMSRAVKQCLGSCASNKYTMGQPGERSYVGNQFVDEIERLAQTRALQCFGLSPDEWGVNVQPYSGTSANFAAYAAIMEPQDRLMGLDHQSGGHLTHGAYSPAGEKVSASSVFFNSLPYHLDPVTGYIDYDRLDAQAVQFCPKLLICGASTYPRNMDFARFREIADKVGSVLLCDMAHVSGLVAAGEVPSPFDLCDIVTSTTHKSLRGPRQGLIFFRRGTDSKGYPLKENWEERINKAVFPLCQGGQQNNSIAALAVALLEAQAPHFKEYQAAVKGNAQTIHDSLSKLGHEFVTGGTDNHLLLWDLRPSGLTGCQMETLCDIAHISVSKSTLPGDSSSHTASGLRIGTPAMTSRGLGENDFSVVAGFLDRAARLSSKIQEEVGTKLKDFTAGAEKSADVDMLRRDVVAFCHGFPIPGSDN